MKKVNQLVICRDDYNDTEEFYNALRDALMVILNNKYECAVRYDEPGFGIVSFEYDYDRSNDFGNPLPYWLTPDEAASVVWDDEQEHEPDDSSVIYS